MEYALEATNGPPGVDFEYEPREAKPNLGLAHRFLDTRLGKFALATMCSVALSGIFSAESAAAPRVSKAQVATTNTLERHVGLGYALVTDCDNPPASASLKIQEETMDCLLDQAQLASSDTPPMVISPILQESTELKNEDIAKCGISHYACGRRFYYYITSLTDEFNCYGENIAWGTGSDGTMQARFRALMESPTHRANIVNENWDFYGTNVERIGNMNVVTTEFASYDRCETSSSGSINYAANNTAQTSSTPQTGTSWIINSPLKP